MRQWIEDGIGENMVKCKLLLCEGYIILNYFNFGFSKGFYTVIKFTYD